MLDRLDAAELATTLDLFAAGASRRYVAEQIRGVLDRQSTIGNPITSGLHQSLTTARDKLVAHNDGLHEQKWGWGATAAELLAASYGIPSDVKTIYRLPAGTLAKGR